MAPDNFIYHYQTLVTGIGALAAAWFAGRPVWRQLAMMRAQSEAMLRDIVVVRITETENRLEKVHSLVSMDVRTILADVISFEERNLRPNEHWAHERYKTLRRVSEELERWGSSHRDVETIEAAKGQLMIAVAALVDKLDEIHTPASSEQSGEDYSIADIEWARITTRGEQAKNEVEGDAEDADRALDALERAYRTHHRSLNRRLRQIDDLLLGEGSTYVPTGNWRTNLRQMFVRAPRL